MRIEVVTDVPIRSELAHAPNPSRSGPRHIGPTFVVRISVECGDGRDTPCDAMRQQGASNQPPANIKTGHCKRLTIITSDQACFCQAEPGYCCSDKWNIATGFFCHPVDLIRDCTHRNDRKLQLSSRAALQSTTYYGSILRISSAWAASSTQSDNALDHVKHASRCCRLALPSALQGHRRTRRSRQRFGTPKNDAMDRPSPAAPSSPYLTPPFPIHTIQDSPHLSYRRKCCVCGAIGRIC
ncbi:hypothetical protein QBC34DRAFT_178274 [Podospora aff. communis PSN243]|uniref:Uncharacterized protein n=1 Tax=Podospora aff. communis PSN243 TaxID=3040156 RepID=A0AAV9H289_9PEZI|nr:hypothetical protein QBC34DRAFT_178274 [Podospora aff. communis PSN243]